MTYILLLGAIVTEVIGTSLLKYTEGFTRLWPTLGTLTAYGLAFFFLAQSLERGMQVGIAYATWSGLGILAIATIGVLFLGDTFSVTKLAGVILIIAGVVTLNLGGAQS